MENNRTPNLHIGPGQVRISHMPEAEISEVADSIRAALGNLQGVDCVQINRSTGSILINHDSSILSPERILESVGGLYEIKSLEHQHHRSLSVTGIRSLGENPAVAKAMAFAEFTVASRLFTPPVAFGLFMPSEESLPGNDGRTERLRLKIPAIRRNPQLAGEIKSSLKKQPGIIQATVRPLTGSLTVMFNPDLTGIDEITGHIGNMGHRWLIASLRGQDESTLQNSFKPEGALQKIIGKAARRAARDAVNRLFEQ